MIAALNELEIKLDNILNVYVQAPVTKRVWTALGPEFGRDARTTAVIVRALYGLNQQEYLLEATLIDEWNLLGKKVVMLIQIYGWNQKSD